MPPMHFCGRRWHCAEDDLLLAGYLSAAANASNAAACALLALDIQEHFPDLALWLTASAGASWAAVLLDIAVIIVSRRGAILDAAPRAALKPLLTLRSLLIVCQVATLIGGTVAAYQGARALPSAATPVFAARWSVFCVWLSLLLTSNSGAGAGELLLRPCRRLVVWVACCAGIRRHDSELILMLTELHGLFRGFEATVSDVVAGFVLMARAQRSVRCGNEAPSLSELNLHDFPWGVEDEMLLLRSRGGALPYTKPMTDRALMEELLHHFCFAMASYGWLFHTLYGRGRLRDVPKEQGPASHRRNRRAAIATLKSWEGHGASVLCHLSRANFVKMPVYAVFADPSYKRVVVAVRGTLSVSDAVTDVLARPFENEECSPKSKGSLYVHEGMWESARRIHQDLKSRGILEALLSNQAQDSQWGAAGTEGKPEALPDCRGYGLLVTGHSLGGGVAQLLTIILRRDYPETRCLAYSSPPTCSERLSRIHGEKAVTVIVGDDVVPRLSVRNAEFLLDRMLALAAHCTLPKHKLTWGALHKNWDASLDACLAKQPVSPQARRAMAARVHIESQPRFFQMGRICYLRAMESKTGCCGRLLRDTRYSVESAQNEDFGEILISRRMIKHHMPHITRRALELALQGWHALPQQQTCWGEEARCEEGVAA